MRNEKEHSIGEKHFKIPEISPQKGCHWAKKLLGAGASGSIQSAIEKILDMPFKDFVELQYDFLKDVVVLMESGRHRIYNEFGEISDASISGPELLELTTVSMAHSMSPFFDQALGKRIGESLKPLFQNLGLTTSSTTQSDSSNGNSESFGTEPTA